MSGINALVDANGAIPGTFDYRTQPLGSLPGEGHLQVPYNLRPDRVIVRVRNLSATLKRRVVKEAVSIRRGGNEQLKNKERAQYFGDRVSPIELQFRVAQGENMNWEIDVISPVDYILRHDNERFLIPAVDAKTGEQAPWKNVPSGAWDLYMGNWNLMHSNVPRERTDEISRLATRGLSKWVAGGDNLYGFLEFDRQIIQIEHVAVDQQMLSAGAIIEV